MTGSRAPLQVDRDGGVATLCLDRAEGNTLDLEMAQALRDSVDELRRDPPLVLRLLANGRILCAGGNIHSMAAATDRFGYFEELASLVHTTLANLRTLPTAVIAGVQGPAAGGGVGLVLAADVVVASTRSSFVAAYGTIGLTPDCGVSALLPAVVGPRRAALFTLTDLRLDAATALEWGLVTEVCEPDALRGRVDAITDQMVGRPGGAVGETARLLRLAADRSYARQLDVEASTVARLGARPVVLDAIAPLVRRSAG